MGFLDAAGKSRRILSKGRNHLAFLFHNIPQPFRAFVYSPIEKDEASRPVI